MLIGVPKEIKVHEYRVGLTPESVREVVAHGHRVLVERNAGVGIGATDADYRTAGAAIADSAAQVFADADLIVKIKEPLATERKRLRDGQALFTYLHLAPDAERTRELVSSGVIAIAYETVTGPPPVRLPLLAPMSEVAGRMSIQVAAYFLERPHGGRGVLISGASGVPPARVVVLGTGVVGANAAQVAVGIGAEVVALNRSSGPLERLAALGPRVKTLISTPEAIETQLREADAVIGAALVPGARTPKLVTRTMLKDMKAGAVMVDVSIDQGGCFETSRPTTHAEPVYTVDGIVHYCVANMPGAVPRTSTYALNRATLPFVLELADRGVIPALKSNEHLRDGLNVFRGHVTRREIAEPLGYAYREPMMAIGS